MTGTSMQAMKALTVSTALALAGCSSTSVPFVPAEGPTVLPFKPVQTPRPNTLKPGLNVWDNGDGTGGAVFARVKSGV